ncbi:hypothetical protein V1525DRAFT_397906 [Lipomyces kononenkoae]|uniref:Uncharacterized protein n=1 Tax=Lipomyces kononenkoae TaxID=34357 RepID=A0ACC3T6M8_LIPKO
MSSENEFVRFASPNERRPICREELGIYHAVNVAGVYQFPQGTSVASPRTFFHPLKQCIEAHPDLCVIIKDAHTEKPFFERVLVVDLEKHITIVKDNVPSEEWIAIGNVLAADLDKPFRPGIPPWRIVVLPWDESRCLVAFSYSHTIGDGPTGVIFHRTFLKACREVSRFATPSPRMVDTTSRKLADPFDKPGRLPISWSYLLAPLIKLLFPRFLLGLLRLQDSLAEMTPGTWAGVPILKNPKGSHSRIKVREIEAAELKRVLNVVRQHDAKLTSTVHQLIARAFDKVLNKPDINQFVSVTPIDMRRAISASSDLMGNFITARYTTHPRPDSSLPFSEESWQQARSGTRNLAECAATLQDQPIGLLRYVSKIHKWTSSKLGQDRDSSFEVSNIGVFDADAIQSDGDATRLVKIIFSQPGHVLAAPICFNFVSVKGGSLVYTVTWQVGALGVSGDDEDQFAEDICSALSAEFEKLAT